MKRFLKFSLVTAALATSALASAQPTGYAGPSSKATAKGNAIPTNVALMTVKQLLANGKNDQYARLQGKLVNHKGGEDYEFTDASGKITVEIDDDRFPAGVRIDQNTMVELVGEFDKNMLRDSTFEVEQIKIVTK
ncbi:MAG: NirD/YgiW/YdeI family stress tolerance protein [Massilia sp.]|nr:NirD/YgiW/YdeI family stress tolerance protein [Massilia sp.]MDB5793569.1 NirD/YgiW/YdeI family stress tolerance protein [Massilia sp.]